MNRFVEALITRTRSPEHVSYSAGMILGVVDMVLAAERSNLPPLPKYAVMVACEAAATFSGYKLSSLRFDERGSLDQVRAVIAEEALIASAPTSIPIEAQRPEEL